MAHLAYLALPPHDLSPPNTAAYARAFDTDPERTEQGIEKRIALVPYEGSLSSPADLLATGLANSLDRAQLVQAVLKSSGIETRIVSTGRSEEHTSELQSHLNLVCRLLLEKKK